MLYVHEMDQLKLREADLLRRVGEMEAVDEYKRLQKQLNELQKADSGIERGGSGHVSFKNNVLYIWKEVVVI